MGGAHIQNLWSWGAQVNLVFCFRPHFTLLCDLEGELPLSGPKYPQLYTKASGVFSPAYTMGTVG